MFTLTTPTSFRDPNGAFGDEEVIVQVDDMFGLTVAKKMETIRMPVSHGNVEATVQQHKKGPSSTYRVGAVTESLDGFKIAKRARLRWLHISTNFTKGYEFTFIARTLRLRARQSGSYAIDGQRGLQTRVPPSLDAHH